MGTTEMTAKDEVRIKLMDNILLGNDIVISTIKMSIDDEVGTSWSLVARDSGWDTIELFTWGKRKSPLASTLQLAGEPITLKDALALVEEHWEERLPIWT